MDNSDSEREIEVEDIPPLGEEEEVTVRGDGETKLATVTGKAKKNKKRSLRRKTLKRRREKKRAKRLKEKEELGVKIVSQNIEKESPQELSLRYIRLWNEDREVWKFSKTRQRWLLKSMLDRNKIPEEDFKILLQYIAGLNGIARTTTITKMAEMTSDGTEVPEDVSLKRIRKVQAVLSDNS